MPVTLELLQDVKTLNPWLTKPDQSTLTITNYIDRDLQEHLMNPEWDSFWTILLGPRRAGKTTLANHLCYQLLKSKRFSQLLYLNCDYDTIRLQLKSASTIIQLVEELKLDKPIIFIDEVQRFDNPGLLLKALIDLNLPYKWIATGSSQLEIKSKVTEHLTGRAIVSTILPLSTVEYPLQHQLDSRLIYGSYPRIIQAKNKQIILGQLYKQYIEKDIVTLLKIDKPHIIEKLIVLITHSSSQLVNYQQLATDCQISIPTVQSHLQKLEQTYVIAKLRPFVGNKRTEITNNPKYYFIDNGFRNQALRNFNPTDLRSDNGALVENFVFQELLKLNYRQTIDFDLYFWRTKAKAEVDFIVYKNDDCFIPIESKYSNIKTAKISRSFRSFISAYQPKIGIIITKSLVAEQLFDCTLVYFIPLEQIDNLFKLVTSHLASPNIET